ncbi:TetR/AcrR family transcriptional regulator [Levilactobacillus spicheri]|uniref:TetR family transcriptional regulator n=2 Tax=Levilactobacillus spicheri TaxID=216463 RepID=A0A0F3RPN2_9LACO|nr:TetR/AcrR family transcriptional regulator [Levilactobacillus spicheri]KJW11840.1 TetR family transcriptional regulator [Levilactobacillus spicheri]KRL46705.1 transcriptional regulator [Levilactobacillus spicheri DSM 15429]GEO66084.1 TetR family transcriptional regulator [Levilactobacillus spicheri]
MKRKEQLTHTHTAILAAARKAFLTQGYQATSTREIAREVGITQPALYHHFSDKEAIFLAVVNEVGQEAKTGMEQVIAQVRAGEQTDGVEALAAMTEVLLKVHPRDVFTVLHGSFRFLQPDNQGQLGRLFMADYLQPLQAFFTLDVVTLQPGMNAQEAANFYLTSLSPLFNNFHHVGPADASPHQQVVTLLRLILFGIAVKK